MKTWRSTRVQLAAGVIVASHLICGTTWAKEGALSPDEAATTFYRVGLEAARTEDWSKARQALAAAFRLKPDAEIAGTLGWAESMAGAPRDAAEHLSFFLREATDLPPEGRHEAEELLRQVKAKIGTVKLRVDAAGAELFLDGKKLGTSPLKEALFVEPGNRKFEARKAGFLPTALWVDVEPGSNPVVAIGLAKAAKPAPPLVPLARKDVTAESGDAQRRTTIIGAGIGVSAGLAAIGIGTAIGTAVSAAERDNNWSEQGCTPSDLKCRSEFDAMEGQRAALGSAAIWSFVGSAAVGVGTLTYALVTRKPSKSTHSPEKKIVLSVQGGGFVLRGRF